MADGPASRRSSSATAGSQSRLRPVSDASRCRACAQYDVCGVRLDLLVDVSLLLTGIAPHWAWAIPGCFFTGLGFYMLHNTLQINATQMAPERRGAAVSAFASCFFLGQSLGVGIAGMIADHLGTMPVLVLGAAGMLGVGLNFSRLQQKRIRARA